MVSLWYCCECNFGPHVSDLHSSCISCDQPRCSNCVEELDPELLLPHEKHDSKMKSGHQRSEDGKNKRAKAKESPDIQVHDQEHSSVSQSESNTSTGTSTTTGTQITSFSRKYTGPSVGQMILAYISKNDYQQFTSARQVCGLQTAASELQDIYPPQTTSYDGITSYSSSLANDLKGWIEMTTSEKFDWWPLREYIPSPGKDETRLYWQCYQILCGDTRWAIIPVSLAIDIYEARWKLQHSPMHDLSQSTPGNAQGGFQNSNIQAPGHTKVSKRNTTSTTSSSSTTHPRSSQEVNSNPHADLATMSMPAGMQTHLHVFLLLKSFSVLGESYVLQQSSVRGMDDSNFFTWIREAYYSQRPLLMRLFGLYSYAYCDFFRIRRIDGYHFFPVTKEFPDENQSSYHFVPKPMKPQPPMSPHEFNHWFYRDCWSKRAKRTFTRKPLCIIPFEKASNGILAQKIPKRDKGVDEGISLTEDFWGLYVIERRSIFKLGLYSLLMLSPSIYFFFAWLFQWRHSDDLQNASVPLVLTSGCLVTFWGYVLSTSPRFSDKDHVI